MPALMGKRKRDTQKEKERKTEKMVSIRFAFRDYSYLILDDLMICVRTGSDVINIREMTSKGVQKGAESFKRVSNNNHKKEKVRMYLEIMYRHCGEDGSLWAMNNNLESIRIFVALSRQERFVHLLRSLVPERKIDGHFKSPTDHITL